MTSSSAALGAAIFSEVLAYWFGIRCVCAIKVVCPLKRNGGIPAMRLRTLIPSPKLKLKFARFPKPNQTTKTHSSAAEVQLKKFLPKSREREGSCSANN